MTNPLSMKIELFSLFFILILLSLTSRAHGQEDRFVGLIDNQLVEVDFVNLEVEVIAPIPDLVGTVRRNMAFDPDQCLFYTVIEIATDPTLVSFDYQGNATIIGRLTIPGGTVSTAEAIAYSELESQMYVSGSLNGVDFYSESLMKIDVTTAECERYVELFVPGDLMDIDDMVFDGDRLYALDVEPGPFYVDLYDFKYTDLPAVYTPTSILRFDNNTSGDPVIIDDLLYMPMEQNRMVRIDPGNPVYNVIGITHPLGSFNNARIRGTAKVADLMDFDYSQNLGPDRSLCEEGSVTLSIAATNQNVVWSDGQQSNSATFSQAGEYSAVVYHGGCPIYFSDTVRLFRDTVFEQITFDICPGLPVTVNGEVYTEQGFYPQLLESAEECDSILFVEVQLGGTIEIMETYDLCEGASIELYGEIYTSAGSYQQLNASLEGCDTLVDIEINELELDTVKLEYQICSGGEVEVNDLVYTATGQYVQTLASADGCDSTLLIDVEVADMLSLFQSYTICDGESVEVYTEQYFSEGFYTYVLTSLENCDTTVLIEVAVLPVDTTEVELELCSGGEVLVNGQLIDEVGEYTQVVTNQADCDSVLLISVVLGDPIEEYVEFEICAGDSVSINEISYFDSFSGEAMLRTEDSCDSLLFFDVVVIDSRSEVLDVEICDGGSVVINSDPFSMEGSFVQTLVSDVGCDSLLTINIETVRLRDTLLHILCEDLVFDGITYREAGVFEQTVRDENECFVDYHILVSDVEEGFYVPNVFRPDSDQIENQCFGAIGSSSISIVSFEVFDRWGNMVHSAYGFPLGQMTEYAWKGMMNGKSVESGVYSYLFRVSGTCNDIQLKSGTVTLLR